MMRRVSSRGRWFSIVVAAIAWFAVLLQCYLTLATTVQNGRSIGAGVISFLGYFTVITNLLIGISLTLPLAAPESRLGKFFLRPDIMTCVATSILFVGLSYHFLLRNVWHPQGLHLLANDLLHYVIPVLYLIYWWLLVPKTALRWSQPFIWGVYPGAYLVYALIRGLFLGTYPYGFIDVSVIGYQRTMLNAFGLLFVFFVLGLLLVTTSRLQKRPVL
jgi:hypothetical protein